MMCLYTMMDNFYMDMDNYGTLFSNVGNLLNQNMDIVQ